MVPEKDTAGFRTLRPSCLERWGPELGLNRKTCRNGMHLHATWLSALVGSFVTATLMVMTLGS